MVAIDSHDNPRATREFEADVVILHHSTTVAPGYQPVIHCGVVRQAAAILSMTGTESGVEALRTGQTATVRFRFMVSFSVGFAHLVCYFRGCVSRWVTCPSLDASFCILGVIDL